MSSTRSSSSACRVISGSVGAGPVCPPPEWPDRPEDRTLGTVWATSWKTASTAPRWEPGVRRVLSVTRSSLDSGASVYGGAADAPAGCGSPRRGRRPPPASGTPPARCAPVSRSATAPTRKPAPIPNSSEAAVFIRRTTASRSSSTTGTGSRWKSARSTCGSRPSVWSVPLRPAAISSSYRGHSTSAACWSSNNAASSVDCDSVSGRARADFSSPTRRRKSASSVPNSFTPVMVHNLAAQGDPRSPLGGFPEESWLGLVYTSVF